MSASTTPPPTSTTTEEDRLDGPVPQALVRHGGHTGAVAALTTALSAAGSAEEARRAVSRRGLALWMQAIRRLRETDGDDRPLYWARLALRRTVRAWRPDFDVDHGELLTALEHASRGIVRNGLPAGPGRLRVVLTGFDPFRLDTDIRRGNPSGAAALALHGTTLRTVAGRTAHIEAVVLPVRWADFTGGVVEHALRPYLEPSDRRADLFMTISQGRPGAFDLERYNGARRGAEPDNAGERAPGPVPVPEGSERPEWTETTLPYAALAAARTGPYPVRDNTSVTEVADGGEPVERPDGPTPGSSSRAGGGGDYLSNEVAYRATRLRDELGAKVPGGHLHTPVPSFAQAHADPESGRITDQTLVTGRREITAQIRALLGVAADSLG